MWKLQNLIKQNLDSRFREKDNILYFFNKKCLPHVRGDPFSLTLWVPLSWERQF